MTLISVIVGSTRQGRFSEKPAQWILQARGGAEVWARVVDRGSGALPGTCERG